MDQDAFSAKHETGNNLKNEFDVVIVGSGPAGVNAAYPLVKAGLRVAMIDGGLDSKKQERDLLEFPDAKLTKTGHYYDFVKKSSYVFNKTYELLPIKSNIDIIQSLAMGGLSEVWHGICDFYSDSELKIIGLPTNEIRKEYEEITKRLKITSQKRLEFHGELLFDAAWNKTDLQEIVYKAPLAFSLRTKPMLYYFKQFSNFSYFPNYLVTLVEHQGKEVEIQSLSIENKGVFVARAQYVILAAGSINSTRIVLRSLGLYNYKTTFLTKANHLMACMHLRTVIKRRNEKGGNFGQLVISSNETYRGTDAMYTQLYRLNPLMLNNAIKYIPLPKLIATSLLSLAAPLFVIADIRFPAFESKMGFCQLKKGKGTKDVLEISFREPSRELISHKNGIKKISKQLRSLGLLPVKTINGYISSHYAGGVPYQYKPGKLSTDIDGKLHQANRIYIADASTWRMLPAKPPTLTIMANASRIGKNVLRRININNNLQT